MYRNRDTHDLESVLRNLHEVQERKLVRWSDHKGLLSMYSLVQNDFLVHKDKTNKQQKQKIWCRYITLHVSDIDIVYMKEKDVILTLTRDVDKFTPKKKKVHLRGKWTLQLMEGG